MQGCKYPFCRLCVRSLRENGAGWRDARSTAFQGEVLLAAHGTVTPEGSVESVPPDHFMQDALRSQASHFP